ncbi:hypothetical protein [Streptomyces silvisoli]|uniref:Cytochrome P450 n=1 Tax=Streptomyces silvisoli TaxID=3034235 RepID=A0ABT5ZVX4_9ACTN|nr:hypothetical protein [Streptomyces silvisoli]MDF3293891.1 hypothetical protein [Streptomyces silvisoli]
MTMPSLEQLTPPGMDFATAPYPLYAHLRERGPVHRVTAPEGSCPTHRRQTPGARRRPAERPEQPLPHAV